MENWCRLTSQSCLRGSFGVSDLDWSSRKLELRAVMEEKFSWDKNVESTHGDIRRAYLTTLRKQYSLCKMGVGR